MWNFINQDAANVIDALPTERSIFLVRRWVGKSPDGVISFVARNPEEVIQQISMEIEFEPDVGVIVGYVQDGKFFNENGYEEESFEADSVLAWTTIPGVFFNEADTAKRAADMLLSRVAGA